MFAKGTIHQTDLVTAECVKLMENTFRDVNIALANEFSLIADKFMFNISAAIELANKHPRVNILQPGIGVGGHCIAIDPWFLTEDIGNDLNLIRTRPRSERRDAEAHRGTNSKQGRPVRQENRNSGGELQAGRRRRSRNAGLGGR